MVNIQKTAALQNGGFFSYLLKNNVEEHSSSGNRLQCKTNHFKLSHAALLHSKKAERKTDHLTVTADYKIKL